MSQVDTPNDSPGYPGAEADARWRQLVAPADYVNPTPAERYHLVIIGAGTAGLISAIGTAGLGGKVALVERQFMGGDCLNVGCVPSKALLAYTREHPDATFDGAFRWLREVRANIAPHDSVERYTELGVDVFLGDAALDGDDTVVVGEHRLKARRIALCTGAKAALPPIPGLQEAAPLTNESVFELQEQPRRLAILGAGAIGCELSQVFARLGTEVHLYDLAPRVLPLESERASEQLRKALEAEGVRLHLGAGVEALDAGTGETRVTAGGETTAVDRVLVALGRRPNTDGLGLETAGVDRDPQGFIVVDDKLRTSNRRVLAAGDCASRVQFTHHADAMARVLVQNALFAPTARVSKLVVPHCTYTQPEVASVGETEASLTEAGVPFDRYCVEFGELDRGRAENDQDSYAEVFTAKGSDKLLGASIVGHDAGEQLAAVVLLMSNGQGLGAAARTIYSYPTRAEYLKRLANEYNRSRLTPTVARLFKGWLDLLLRFS